MDSFALDLLILCSKEKVKEIDSKKSYFFDDLINMKNLNPNSIKII